MKKLGFKDLFKDLTWMQVGAGALAAATSLFFASSIGIAGSVIGAAVGSIVTTVSSALYKSFLTASNNAIKEKLSGAEGPDANQDAPVSPVEQGAHFAALSAEKPPQSAGATQVIAPVTDATQVIARTDEPTRQAPAVDRTQAMPRTPVRDPQETARVRELVRHRKKERSEKLVLIVSLVTGFIAVLGCALVVYTATNGDGLGYRPAPATRPAIVETPPTEPDAPATSDEPSAPVDANAGSEPSAPQEQQGPAEPDDTTVTAPAEPIEPTPDQPDTGADTPQEPSPEEPPTTVTAPVEPTEPDGADTTGSQETAATAEGSATA